MFLSSIIDSIHTHFHHHSNTLSGWRLAEKSYNEISAGFEINARPLARGEWKSRGMRRIFAQVVWRASGYFNLFCKLYVPTNESNYWNFTRMTVKIITNRRNNLVYLITLCKLYIIIELSSAHSSRVSLSDRTVSKYINNLRSPITYDGLTHTLWPRQQYLD